MTTRKEVIINLYKEVYDYSHTFFPDTFPSLDEMDVIDLIFVLTTYFCPYYDSGDYRQVIKALMKQVSCMEMDDDDFEKHYKNIENPLHKLVKFIKTM